ncbi:MAG: MerR family transcriptional regulator [Candidatus Ancaeobacter aquaticus]|nr:MerR family transcriptional regulator [Candidatus Ancaeobacter aquaticus]
MKTYYKVSDVLKQIGIARSTLYNWEKAGLIPQPKRNRAGYRVYTEGDIKKIAKYAFKIEYPQEQLKLFKNTH